MKTCLLLIVIFCYGKLYAQEHNSDTSFAINKKTFKIQTKDILSNKVTLTIFRNSKVVKVDTLDAAGLSYLKFPDFDRDGNRDIMVTYLGNNNTYDLYLFDQTKNVFKFVKGFNRFPDSQPLRAHKKYFYSYHRAGCADYNWVSDLFFIENFKTIHIGQINGKGCEFDLEQEPRAIEISKITDNKEDQAKLLVKLPYKKNIPTFGDKWNFIESYWGKNYAKFVPRQTTNR